MVLATDDVMMMVDQQLLITIFRLLSLGLVVHPWPALVAQPMVMCAQCPTFPTKGVATTAHPNT